MTSKLLVSLLLLGLSASVFTHADNQVPSAQELIAAAHRQTELTGIAPYVLSATVVINPGDKKEQTGHLTIYRDRDRSRVDLVVGDYSETRTTVGDRTYIPRGKQLLNSSIAALDESWDPGARPRYSTQAAPKFGRVKKATVNGRSAWCFDKNMQFKTDRLCFDAASSLLISQNSSRDDHDEYLDYGSTGQKSFPRRVKIRKKWMAPMEVRDISISAGSLDDHLFAVPPDAIELGACKKELQPPKPVSTPEPDFPAGVHKSDVVVLSAIVNRNGQVEEVVVLNPDSDGFGAQASQSVARWRFKPATCG
ncbi:MAG TPA: energy transducer TonB, partial [Terriglobales bacterium]|nr:energy transducer TonB [Terriglobales bacterium]